MVTWSTGHWWGNFKATLIAPLTPQALSWFNHKQVLLSATFIASFAILCLAKRQKLKYRELLYWNWSGLISGKSKYSTRKRSAGKYFLSSRFVCHSGPEMLPFVKGRVRRDIIFFRSQSVKQWQICRISCNSKRRREYNRAQTGRQPYGWWVVRKRACG